MTLPRETPQQARDHFHQLWSQIEPLLPAPDAAVRTEDVFIQPDQRIRIYTPAKAAAEASSPLPVGLYIHCGGWYSGSIDIEDFLCRNVAENAGIILFSPDYRLAPENPYPAGFEDVCRAYEWMHDHAATYGGDAQRKFTMGGSAGGNLSACVAVKYAAHETLRVSGFISACLPACDPKCLPEKYRPRFTPELYPNAPMVGSETLAQARGMVSWPSTPGWTNWGQNGTVLPRTNRPIRRFSIQTSSFSSKHTLRRPQPTPRTKRPCSLPRN